MLNTNSILKRIVWLFSLSIRMRVTRRTVLTRIVSDLNCFYQLLLVPEWLNVKTFVVFSFVVFHEFSSISYFFFFISCIRYA